MGGNLDGGESLEVVGDEDVAVGIWEPVEHLVEVGRHLSPDRFVAVGGSRHLSVADHGEVALPGGVPTQGLE